MEAEHLPLSRGSRQSTGTAVTEDPENMRQWFCLSSHVMRHTSVFCNATVCTRTGGSHLRITQWQHVTVYTSVLTFLWAAVLHARVEVIEVVGIARAAAEREGLTLHGGHVEEVAGKEAPAGPLVSGEPADLGNLCGGGTTSESELRPGRCECIQSKVLIL